MDAGDLDMDPEAIHSMPSSLDGGDFYAPSRLRLLPASILPAEAPFGKTSFWLFTVTPESKAGKKTFAVAEFVLVYVPPETTKVAGWDLGKQVRVYVVGPETLVTPGFQHTVQVVNPCQLIPVPGAQLFASVRVVGTRNGPLQLMAVQAIVASYDSESKFKRFQYFVEQPHNKPPVEFVTLHSKDWAETTLERIDVDRVKLLNEEDTILNLPVGRRLWLQIDGSLHAGLVMQRTTTLAVDLILVCAEPKPKEVSGEATELGEAASATGLAATGAGTGENVSMRTVNCFLVYYIFNGQVRSMAPSKLPQSTTRRLQTAAAIMLRRFLLLSLPLRTLRTSFSETLCLW